MAGAIPVAHAVPAFARQTGLPCQSCHTVAPELTAFGRDFKLRGFVLSTLPKVESKTSTPLSLNRMPAFAAEIDIADTFTQASQPGTQNGNVQFPSKLKLFLAGALSDNIGMFSYLEYTQPDDHLSIDLTDIRIVGSGQVAGRDAIYGLTINNAPTLEDPWNTLNVWSFPHVHSEVAPTPATAALLGGTLADSGLVAGVGGYILWDNHWYADLTLYRSAPTGAAQPLVKPGATEGLVPYGRFAWQTTLGPDYLEVGASAIQAKFIQGIAGTGFGGLDDRYRDVSVDAQYEHPVGDNLLTLHATYIHEQQSLDASAAAGLSNSSDSLNTLRADGTFLLRPFMAFSLAYFSTTGSADPLLYTAAPVSGAAGKPDSDGWILQADYLPWQNVQLIVQYTLYDRFNGTRTNYDGAGRSASDNNTIFLLAMFDF
ncbi:MAG TPA: hypothetical protein VET46_15885 [Steroidobacteraceae bacterium]|nr:hypothetical protein [Steroidobacteraceae bacterium]